MAVWKIAIAGKSGSYGFQMILALDLASMARLIL